GRMLSAVERLEAGATDLARLRLVHLAMSGAAKLSEADRDEIDRITGESPAVEALGLEPGSPASAVQAAALSGVQKWRERGNRPLSDPATTEACELATRIYEQFYAASASAVPVLYPFAACTSV